MQTCWGTQSVLQCPAVICWCERLSYKLCLLWLQITLWGFPKFYCFNTAVGNGWNSSTSFFPRECGEGEKQKRKHNKMSLWYFFYYIPAKTCSGVLRQRAEPSVFSKGKSTENSVKPSVLHWPLVCSHLFLISVMWHMSAVGKGGHCRSCSWFQLRGTKVTQVVKPSGQMEISSLCWDSPQHPSVGFVLFLNCSSEKPVHP